MKDITIKIKAHAVWPLYDLSATKMTGAEKPTDAEIEKAVKERINAWILKQVNQYARLQHEKTFEPSEDICIE